MHEVMNLIQNLPMIEYRKHYHTAQESHMLGRNPMIGGVKDAKLEDWLAPWARVDALTPEENATLVAVKRSIRIAVSLGLADQEEVDGLAWLEESLRSEAL